MNKQITSFWAKSVFQHEFYVIYWHPKLKYPVLVKVSDKPKSGENLW